MNKTIHLKKRVIDGTYQELLPCLYLKSSEKTSSYADAAKKNIVVDNTSKNKNVFTDNIIRYKRLHTEQREKESPCQKVFRKTNPKKTEVKKSTKKSTRKESILSSTSTNRFSPLEELEAGNLGEEDFCMLDIDTLRKIKVKDRTPVQQKEYEKLMKRRKRSSMTNTEKEVSKINNMKEKQNSRSKMTVEQKRDYQISELKSKQKSRSEMTAERK